ncbi:MAG: YaiI/YqxD family protein [Gammaproteobacteria bacterium]|nr:YaiI/YqxD family protein [Gammaproteobacteria bacterium]
MIIWIDGDACPNKIKELIFRTAIRLNICAYLVSNHLSAIPPSPYIKYVQVPQGFDQADNYIMQHVKKNQLVITNDIILADRVVRENALALNTRGKLYSANNINQILAIRNLNETLRESGMISSKESSLSAMDIKNFANIFDKIITQLMKNS